MNAKRKWNNLLIFPQRESRRLLRLKRTPARARSIRSTVLHTFFIVDTRNAALVY